MYNLLALACFLQARANLFVILKDSWHLRNRNKISGHLGLSLRKNAREERPRIFEAILRSVTAQTLIYVILDKDVGLLRS